MQLESPDALARLFGTALQLVQSFGIQCRQEASHGPGGRLQCGDRNEVLTELNRRGGPILRLEAHETHRSAFGCRSSCMVVSLLAITSNPYSLSSP